MMMNESSGNMWTPGPWKYQYAFDGIYDVLAPNPDANKESVSYNGESLRVADIFNLRDARLIAAAPEMYEALEAVISWVKSPVNHGGSNPYLLEFVQMAQAALAKATGQEVTS